MADECREFFWEHQWQGLSRLIFPGKFPTLVCHSTAETSSKVFTRAWWKCPHRMHVHYLAIWVPAQASVVYRGFVVLHNCRTWTRTRVYGCFWSCDFAFWVSTAHTGSTILSHNAPINVMPHLPHPGQMWGIWMLLDKFSALRGESFVQAFSWRYE